MKSPVHVLLDPTLRSRDALDFEAALQERVVGQSEAVEKVSHLMEMYMAGLQAPNRPVGIFLLLGPTGVGKTRLVEAVGESLFGDAAAVIKIDCSEFQQSHEIAKLLGAPPGYVGHNDKNTKPLVDQEKLDRHQVEGKKLAIVLFDEIEKASDSLFQLLLGVMDKGLLTTGNGSTLDFRHALIFFTSNLGGKAMSDMAEPGMGFQVPEVKADAKLEKRMGKVAIDAARKRFSAEFMNRLDQTVVFQHLTRKEMREVLRIEMLRIQERIISSAKHQQFTFKASEKVKDFLLDEGTSLRYGARHLRRVLDREVVAPLSSLLLSGQIEMGDLILLEMKDGRVRFEKLPSEAVNQLPDPEFEDFKTAGGTYVGLE